MRPIVAGQFVQKKQKMIQITAVVLFSLAVFSFYIYKNLGAISETTEYGKMVVAVDLEPGVVLEQNLSRDVENISSFSIKYGTYGRCNVGTIHVALYEDNNIVQRWDTEVSGLVDNEYEHYVLDEILRSDPDHNYYITIEAEFGEGSMVAVWGDVVDDSFQIC